jgi:hypothetical protein
MTQPMTASDFPLLSQFLGSWFHQDYALDGDVPDIVALYRATAGPDEIAALIDEISRFLRQSAGQGDAAFVETFHPDIDPAGWELTAEAWLGWVRRLLEAPPT